MSPICKASSAASAAGGPGDAGAKEGPSAVGASEVNDVTTSTGSSAGQEGRVESSAGTANVDPSVNARLKKSLEDYEPPAVKTLTSPELPTQAEIDEHNVSHQPYRAWCRYCVMGRGKADPHRKIEEKEIRVPTIACDYCFMGKKSEVEEADRSE